MAREGPRTPLQAVHARVPGARWHTHLQHVALPASVAVAAVGAALKQAQLKQLQQKTRGGGSAR